MPDPTSSLADLVARGGVVVLSGAGLSTESGIPDYRGPTGRARRAMPTTYQEFMASAAARQRYWARSHLGWRHVAQAMPNAGHYAVASLEARGLVSGVISQNVDRLHQVAGGKRVVDLHGRLDRVVCVRCRRTSRRAALDRRLAEANLGWQANPSRLNPDGDAVISDDDVVRFTVADCAECGGLLKPDVVFFGENVPKQRVDRCFRMVDAASLLLVLGSSLTVMSGYRFVRHAARIGVTVAIVNQGATRGDVHADLRIDAPLGALLPALSEAVSGLRPTMLVPG